MQSRNLVISALNIAMESPHSEKRYVSLFQQAFRYKGLVRLRGDHAALIGSLRKEKYGNSKLLRGQIYKFMDLDPDANWYNIAANKPAEEDELERIKIPENLKPHFRVLDFVFLPWKHRLFFVSKDRNHRLSASQARKLFATLFADTRLGDEFGRVEVNVEPSREALDSILKLQRLQRLRIEVHPPNADDLHEEEQKLFGDLDSQNAERRITEFVSSKDAGLKPSDKTVSLARIAQSNGSVQAHGQNNDGISVDISTENHPLLDVSVYNPKGQTVSDFLLARALDLLGKLK